MTRPVRKQPMFGFADAVRQAFERRARAISRRGAKIECTPVKEIEDGCESEIGRTDVLIRYRVDGAAVVIRVQAWGDRWIWFDARRTSKRGWLWEYTAEGRFVHGNDVREIVARAEQSLDAAHMSPEKVGTRLDEIWSSCLAATPRVLK